MSEDLWSNIPFSNLYGLRNLNKIAINPFNSDEVFISSFQDGLLELNENIPEMRHDQTNSGLESLVLPGAPNFISLRLSGLKFDSRGLLWSITSLVQKPLKSYDPNSNQWRSYDFSNLINNPINDNLGFNDIAINSSGTKFIASSSKGVIGFNENNLLLKSQCESLLDLI